MEGSHHEKLSKQGYFCQHAMGIILPVLCCRACTKNDFLHFTTVSAVLNVLFFLSGETFLRLQNIRHLKPGYIEFGVVCIDSVIVACIHSAILQLLLTRRVS